MILITTILFIIPIFFVFLQKVRTLFGTIPLIALRALASRGFIGCIPLYKQTILKSKIFPRYRLIHLLK